MQTQTEADDRNWVEAKEVFQHGPDPLGVRHEGTPSYYRNSGQDLYDLFIVKYGLLTWLRHVEMECIQYLWRCGEKNVYVSDIAKVKVICERILSEMEKSHPLTP